MISFQAGIFFNETVLANPPGFIAAAFAPLVQLAVIKLGPMCTGRPACGRSGGFGMKRGQIPYRLYFLGVLIFLATSPCLRLWYVQIARGAEYTAVASGSRIGANSRRPR